MHSLPLFDDMLKTTLLSLLTLLHHPLPKDLPFAVPQQGAHWTAEGSGARLAKRQNKASSSEETPLSSSVKNSLGGSGLGDVQEPGLQQVWCTHQWRASHI